VDSENLEVKEEDLEPNEEILKKEIEVQEVKRYPIATQRIQGQSITHSNTFSNCSTPHSHYSTSDVQSVGEQPRTNDGFFTNDILEESYKKLKVEKLEMEAEMELREKHFKELEGQKGALKNEFNQIMNQNKTLIKEKEDIAQQLREIKAENSNLKNQLKETKGKSNQVFSTFCRILITFGDFCIAQFYQGD
jgi:DNA repair exonuclease SbcCD ATPase subunit